VPAESEGFKGQLLLLESRHDSVVVYQLDRSAHDRPGNRVVHYRKAQLWPISQVLAKMTKMVRGRFGRSIVQLR
jgi:hypothetical protein